MIANAAIGVFAPHRIVMAAVFGSALLAGIAILPGANERVAMLERDGHSREALSILESEYANGDRRYRTLYQMQSLYESEGNVAKARELLEAMAQANPRDFAIRSRLAQFYKSAQDQTAYVQALKAQIDLKYSEAACRELIALDRLAGDYKSEQSALQQCRQRGYRRPDDLSRLAELVATDGDSTQAVAILRSVDDLKRLKTVRERYQLLSLLLEQDQPKEAERRAVRWIKGTKDDALAVGLIDTLAHSKFPASAMEVAKDAGAPGDSISLTVAERLVEQSQMVPAQLYLKGWLDKAQLNQETVAIRFAEAALAAGDPITALKGAKKFGLQKLGSLLLERLAGDLTNAGLLGDAEQVQKAAGTSPVVREAGKDGVASGQAGISPGLDDQTKSGETAATRRPGIPIALASDPLEPWRRSLWLKMSDDALRRGQALGLAPPVPAITIEPIAASRGNSRSEARVESRQGVSARILKKADRVLQRTKKIKSLRRKSRGGRENAKSAPYALQPVPAPSPVLKPTPYQ